MRISDWSSDVCSSDLRPGLAVAQQLEPRDLAGGIGRIALDQREFGRAEAFGLARGAIESEPGEQPDEAHHAGDDERGAPAISDGDNRHDQRRDARSEEHTSELQYIMSN